MDQSEAVKMLVIYRVKAGKEETFVPLLHQHWPALRAVGLATGTPVRAYRGTPKRGHGDGSVFVELFEWTNAAAPDVAHQTPEVMAVWEPMGPLLEGMELIALTDLEP